MSTPMLTIPNRHSAACGIPPAFRTEAADLYIGYFENRPGEQWIFTFDRATREALLRGGDAGWATAHPVRDGRVDGLILAPRGDRVAPGDFSISRSPASSVVPSCTPPAYRHAPVTLGRAAGLDNLATVESLVGTDGGEDAPLAFHRLQHVRPGRSTRGSTRRDAPLGGAARMN
jgi:hypothetical protein